MKKNTTKDMFIIGFALFSMFFGAGNVIFPPYLGMGSGPKWILGFTCYYIADIGLALFALFSMFRKNGSEELIKPIGKTPSTILMCAIVLCIGPMLALPRTAAMTFEMSVQPLTQGINSIVFSIIFFFIIFLFSIRENSVVDIVGKVLTPLLLFGLLVLIIKGVITPLGTYSTSAQIPNVAQEGVKAGYQTMDVLATMIFGALILRSAETKGYTELKDKRYVAVRASLIAGVLLFVVYCGLTYLGASVSAKYDLSCGRSALMLTIVSSLLGHSGTVLFSIVVALACITTAVGLVSSCAEYFSNLSKNRISYQIFVIAICIFSGVVSNFGLEEIVSISAPVLDIVYPPTLVLIAMSFIPNTTRLSIQCATGGAFVLSTLTAIVQHTGITIPFLESLPFAGLGFGWLVPAMICAIAGQILSKIIVRTPLEPN